VSETKERDSLDFAWRVHDALDSWTGKVDTKSSIALAIESAVLGFVVALSSNGGRLASLHGDELTIYRIGFGFLVLSIALSLAVVFPQLAGRSARRRWRSNMIYFGHLRHWDEVELATALADETPQLEQLARQLVQMSRIAWRKHVWLQWSLISLVISATCLLIAGI
jgi:Family of unknown function (DUF5706)